MNDCWGDCGFVKLENNLYYVMYVFLAIGIIWALYGFFVQKEKEVALKRLLATLIGASVIFAFAYFLEVITESSHGEATVKNQYHSRMLRG